jgi:hypothetical protein
MSRIRSSEISETARAGTPVIEEAIVAPTAV